MTGAGKDVDRVFDLGLQHERTALAWERTAIAGIVVGILLARSAAADGIWPLAALGITQTVVGGAVLVWAGARYDDLHGPIRAGVGVVHPRAARVVSASTLGVTGCALVYSIARLLTGT